MLLSFLTALSLLPPGVTTRYLHEEALAWSRFSGAVTRVMRAAPALP